jgi:hypothetical protein
MIISSNSYTEAIVTLPEKNFIQIINTSTMRAEQMIMIPQYGYGITLIDNDIVLGNIGEIYIMSVKRMLLFYIKNTTHVIKMISIMGKH